LSAEQFELQANVVINAAGVWTDELRQQLGENKVIRPLRGSHLVLPQWRLPVAYSVSFFHPKDKRPVFAFPWEGVTVVGTTDLDHKQSSRDESSISAGEVAYLLAAVNQQFPNSLISESDVIATYSGVRPVVSKHSSKQEADLSKPAKPSDEKREHVVWDNRGMVSVAGGKLTTYRLIALDVLQTAARYLNRKPEDFKSSTHFPETDHVMASAHINAPQIRRLKGRYGFGAERIVELVDRKPELADKVLTSDTIFAELVYACETQLVVHLDDLMLRRTRLKHIQGD
ncbi:FAD-dependent oxidoreductase, partial [Oleiphilus sp. HI0132]|uniref:FAD-dependent oxidoreductase n=1 Tax=Oleiphilus sp. HI0132 TaxID=1822270 RepID=UPI000A6E6505